MTDAELWSAWRIWMGVATVVVLIAASLLVIIWVTARRILADAGRALTAAELAPRYPRFADALALRAELDPGGRFACQRPAQPG